MRPYPYLLNRNGHFYFRMALPLSLRPNFGQRELLYSLKTKDTSEAKRRSLAVLNALEGVLRDAHAGKIIAGHALKEALRALNFYQERNPRCFDQKQDGIKPGTRLVRLWKGRKYQVLVRPDGFEYDGRKYDSLSRIAQEITGTRWNGWLFFGLKGKEKP